MKKLFLNFIIVPKFGTSNLSDQKFVTHVMNIVNSILLNANFPNQQLDTKALEQKINDFVVAKGKVKHGPAGAAAEKDAIRAEIEKMLKNLAIDCARVADGDIAVFLTSGFTAREHHAITNLNTPVKLLLEQGDNETELKLSFKGDDKAAFYKISVGLDTVTPLMIYSNKSTRFVIPNLKPGTRYFVQVMACGAKDIASGWSGFVNCIAA